MRLRPSAPIRFTSNLNRSCAPVPKHGSIVVGAIMLLLAVDGDAQISSANAQFPLGLNLSRLTYYSPELPLANVFNTAGSNTAYTGWFTSNTSTFDTSEEAYLQRDSNGFATSLIASTAPSGGQKFTYIQTFMNYQLGTPAGATYPYPSGQYTLAWTGKGTLVIGGGDASGGAVSSGPCTASGTGNLTFACTGTGVNVLTFQVNSPSAGIVLEITAIPDSINYPRSIYIGLSSLYSAWTTATPSNPAGYFNPAFLTMLQNFSYLRFMDWLNTNNGVVSFTFTSAPSSGATSATLSSAWALPSGSYNVAFATGDIRIATFTVASTAVTWAGGLSGAGTPSATAWYSTKAPTWAVRATPSTAFWGGPNGVPYEICIALANYLNADPWINIPYDASNSFITSLATYVQSNLKPGLKVYVEFGNELWNSIFPGASYATPLALALFGINGYNAYEWQIAWYGVQVANIAQQFYNVFASSYLNAVVVVMSAQAGNTFVSTYELTAPPWVALGGGRVAPYQQTPAKIGAVAVAPYFGITSPSNTGQIATDIASWLADTSLDLFFGQQTGTGAQSPSTPSGGYVATAVATVTSQVAATGPSSAYNLPTLLYESGIGWTGYPNYLNGSGFVNMLNTANRDARIEPVISNYYSALSSAGARTMNYFSDVGGYGQYGEFGLLESPMQSISPLGSAPPKWRAVQNYITGNACSASGCAGTQTGAAAIPMPPTNLQVH
jgi:hypothetical protein